MFPFLQALHRRNTLLYYLGWVCLPAACICWILYFTPGAGQIWLWPARFLFSTTVFAWSVAWLIHYLVVEKVIVLVSMIIAVLLAAENAYPLVFALRRGHVAPDTDNLLLSMMAAGMGFISAIMGWVTYLFCSRSFPSLKRHYLWGIRFGLLFFVLFSLSGNLLAALPGWHVASSYGGSGLPFVNWRPDDKGLRLAHFLGMHALQALPFFGYYVSRRSIITILFSLIYFLAVAAIFMQAVLQQPLIELYLG